jgi:glutamine synthetase adenylyltransferase
MSPITQKPGIRQPHNTRAHRNKVMPKRAAAAMRANNEYRGPHNNFTQLFADTSRRTTYFSSRVAKPSCLQELAA